MKKVLSVILMGLITNLYSWSISPVLQVIKCEKKQTSYEIVADPEGAAVAIACSVANREISEEGKESEVVNKTDFIVYPSRFILHPGQRRVVRVVWKGKETPKLEGCYRFIAESLPVDMSVAGGGDEDNIRAALRMNTKYMTSLYLEPTKIFKKMQSHIISKEDNILTVDFLNMGNKHLLFTDHDFECKLSNGSTLILPAKIAQEAYGTAINILPNHKRIVSFKLDDSMTLNNIVEVNLVEK